MKNALNFFRAMVMVLCRAAAVCLQIIGAITVVHVVAWNIYERIVQEEHDMFADDDSI